ncbi:hypothetical protein GGR53DRAFT_511161 [Hypoxylon sp. FL1150]|nr:hypothetical protein GGR53DRAFT_511161 [Hypoxylon sp. FL1150]
MVLTQITPFAKGQDQQQAEIEARKLIERLGNHPLAIQSAIGSINESSRKLVHWNKRANTEQILSSEHHNSFRYAPYPKGLREAFASRVEGLDDSSRLLLDVLSTLDPDQIPEQLIDQASPAEDLGTIDFVADLDHCVSQVSKGLIVRGVRRETGNPSNESVKDRTSFYMHRLLRDFVHSRMSDKGRQAAFETASKLLSLAIDTRNHPQGESVNAVKYRVTLDQEYTSMYLLHIRSLHEFYEGCCKQHGKNLRVPIHFLRMLVRSSWLCYRAGYLKVGLELVSTAIEIRRGAERKVISIINGTDAEAAKVWQRLYYNHACIKTETGDFQTALESFSEYKSLCDSSGDFTTKDAWRAIGGIANSEQGLGNHEEAIRCYKKCIQLQARPKDVVYSPYEVNICRSYWALNKNDLASERLEELLRLRLKELGAESDVNGYHDYIYGHMNYVLGNVRIAQGRMEEAYSCHKIALSCWRKKMGENHHKTGDAWHKVGWHLFRRHEIEEARIHLKTALKVYRAGFDEGFRQAEIARTTHLLGLVEALTGSSAGSESRRLIQEAEAMRKALMGKRENDRDTVSVTQATYDDLVSLWAR